LLSCADSRAITRSGTLFEQASSVIDKRMASQYSSIELEMTSAMSDSRERQGGLKVWVLDGFRERFRGKTSTHTARVIIEPHTSAGGEVAYTVHE
ncbi:trypco2 family protein, partial [Streptomyces hirsutus]|uniref:trypco2 family protein n=1 Tax=Streptomyces hirsutus TaxID=35620 RepID=UPI0033F1F980